MTTPHILLDSGEFSAFKSGATIELTEYTQFIKRHEPFLDGYVVLDHIPNSHECFERAAQITYEHQKRMKDAGLRPIPVYRKGDDPKWLEKYLDDGEQCIALASRDKRLSPIPWLDDTFARLKDDRGQLRVKVHGLAFTTPYLMLRYPWSSVDSSTWSKQAAHGQIPCPMFRDGVPDFRRRHTIFILSDRIRLVRGRNIDNASGFEMDQVRRWVNMCGLELSQVRYSLPNRWRVWLKFYKSVEATSGVRLFFVSNLTSAFREVLLESGAEHHLQSYFYLRRRESALQNYIDGNLPPPRPRKHDRRSDTYADVRKLALWEYIREFAPDQEGARKVR